MKKFLNYKGIYGEINYSEPDNVFFGEICGTRDIILYEGETIAELEKDFEETVDNYIECCREHGKPLPKFEPIDEQLLEAIHNQHVPEIRLEVNKQGHIIVDKYKDPDLYKWAVNG